MRQPNLQLYLFCHPDTQEPAFVIQAPGVVRAYVRAEAVAKLLNINLLNNQSLKVEELEAGGPYLAPIFTDAYFVANDPYATRTEETATH